MAELITFRDAHNLGYPIFLYKGVNITSPTGAYPYVPSGTQWTKEFDIDEYITKQDVSLYKGDRIVGPQGNYISEAGVTGRITKHKVYAANEYIETGSLEPGITKGEVIISIQSIGEVPDILELEYDIFINNNYVATEYVDRWTPEFFVWGNIPFQLKIVPTVSRYKYRSSDWYFSQLSRADGLDRFITLESSYDNLYYQM